MMQEYQTTQMATQGRHIGRSILAVVAGFFANALLSLATDQVFHILNVYPPWGESMFEPSLNLLALSYRIVFTVVGGYLAARLAPRNPLRHTIILGIVGLVASIAGVFVATKANLGPLWYPISLVVVALPCTWLGGYIFIRKKV